MLLSLFFCYLRAKGAASQAGCFHKQLWLNKHKLNFITLNVRGINSPRKRWAVFRQLHNKNASVIFLQETYSSNNQEKLWSNELGSKIHFWHGSKHSNGVAILFNLKLQVTIESQMPSQDGIKWLETPICALEISFSYNYKLCESENSTPSYIWWKFPTSPYASELYWKLTVSEWR